MTFTNSILAVVGWAFCVMILSPIVGFIIGNISGGLMIALIASKVFVWGLGIWLVLVMFFEGFNKKGD